MMGKKIDSPLNADMGRDESCILCGQTVPNHRPGCEYASVKTLSPPKDDTLESLEARMKEFEEAQPPDFNAIIDLSRKIEKFRENLIKIKETTKSEKSFDDWATSASKNMVNPDDYGEGVSFVEPLSKPAPEPVKEPVKDKPTEKLGGHLEKVKHMLAIEILRSAYGFMTNGGKEKLSDVVKQTRTKQKNVSSLLTQKVSSTLKGDVKGLWQEEVRAKHLEQFKNVIKHGFERIFEAQHVLGKQRHDVILHLILEMQEDFHDIEKKDPGAIRTMKSLLASQFLSPKEVKALQDRAIKRPDAKQPVAKQPDAKQSTPKQPAAKQQAAKQPVAENQTERQPASKSPGAKRPVVKHKGKRAAPRKKPT
jgi:hypothetical protein